LESPVDQASAASRVNATKITASTVVLGLRAGRASRIAVVDLVITGVVVLMAHFSIVDSARARDGAPSCRRDRRRGGAAFR